MVAVTAAVAAMDSLKPQAEIVVAAVVVVVVAMD